jgi:hypothetical protein
MEIAIRYGVDLEVRRILDTLDNINWFEQNGYEVLLPIDVVKGATEAEVKEAVSTEYRVDSFKLMENSLLEKYSLLKDRFEVFIEERFSCPIRLVDVILTKYGVGGSYHPPDRVVINIGGDGDQLKTVLHEIIHLVIYSYIENKNIGHWEIERTVDLLMYDFCAKNEMTINFQDGYNGVEEKVDMNYEKFFPNNAKDFFDSITNE